MGLRNDKVWLQLCCLIWLFVGCRSLHQPPSNQPATPARSNNEQTPQTDKPECDFSGDKPLRISDHSPKVITKVLPEYPRTARDAHIQGRVIVQILIDPDGNVVKACATEGHPFLKEAAIEAILQWKFEKNFGFPSILKSAQLKSGARPPLLIHFQIFNFAL
ncbi:MAG TPA: TonB family protein [Blastocatellia bacterium]|nr:TonB family protein [Blastocatellia bacterium]